MGPHFFKCGKDKGPRNRRAPNRGFNGAALFQVRKVDFRGGGAEAKKKGFNGAALFQVRKEHLGLLYRSRASRFNGAALFQVRKEPRKKKEGAESKALQWGRTFSSAERIRSPSPSRRPLKSFNGAALFQVRKEERYKGAGLTQPRFNGAALFQVRKVAPGAVQGRYEGEALQWGRTFSSAESSPLG